MVASTDLALGGMSGKSGRLKHFDWQGMQAIIEQGHGFIRCRRIYGIAHAKWIKAIERGDIRVDQHTARQKNARKRYDWAAIQEFHDAGNSARA
jgi:hypothetical protein